VAPTLAVQLARGVLSYRRHGEGLP
jgi:hypothetical protein